MMIRIVSICAVVACGVVACGASQPKAEDPDRRLTRDECAASVDHAIELLGPSVPMDRETSIAQCLETATVRDRDCLMKAKTADEMGLCPMPGTR
jgi:hypothetical protein